MLLVAKYAPRKNLEKIHMCQIRPKIGQNFMEKWSNLANPGLFTVKDYFLRKSISQHTQKDGDHPETLDVLCSGTWSSNPWRHVNSMTHQYNPGSKKIYPTFFVFS